jgi:hypothetical protein
MDQKANMPTVNYTWACLLGRNQNYRSIQIEHCTPSTGGNSRFLATRAAAILTGWPLQESPAGSELPADWIRRRPSSSAGSRVQTDLERRISGGAGICKVGGTVRATSCSVQRSSEMAQPGNSSTNGRASTSRPVILAHGSTRVCSCTYCFSMPSQKQQQKRGRADSFSFKA